MKPSDEFKDFLGFVVLVLMIAAMVIGGLK